MKKILLYTVFCLGVASLFGSCSKEEPFAPGDKPTGEAQFLKSSLSVDVKSEETLVRAASLPDVGDFNVSFYLKGAETPTVTYRYRDMPEVVTLKVFGEKSDYQVRVSYGDNAPAAWDAPYYYGEGEFSVTPNSVASDIEPIVCKLSNIRVSINFDPGLTAVMTSDSKVTVKVGDQGSLDFTKQDEGRSGYFAYIAPSSENSPATLTATFYGYVSGVETSVTQPYVDLKPGNHYYITFRLRTPDGEDPGNVNGSVSVDATIERVDSKGNVVPVEDILEDDSRPNQGNSDPEPPSTGDGPEITACEGVLLDATNDIENLIDKPVELYIKSEKGIESFIVEISSTDDKFNNSVSGMFNGLTLDLCNPGKNAETLMSLGLLDDEKGVKGKKDVTFSVTDFMDVLKEFAYTTDNPTQTFTVTVGDADGKTTKKLIIKV